MKTHLLGFGEIGDGRGSVTGQVEVRQTARVVAEGSGKMAAVWEHERLLTMWH